jgi:hypothetical protein
VRDACQAARDTVRVHYDGHADLGCAENGRQAGTDIDTSSRPLRTTLKSDV